MKQKGFFARLADLFRGIFGVQLKNAEARNAEAVYHNAISEHVRHHDRLRDAITRMVYLRNKVEADLKDKQNDLRLVIKALSRSVRGSDDDRAIALIRTRNKLTAEVERLQAELQRLATQSDKAKEGLVEVKSAIGRLKVEREEMLARKAHAVARRDAQDALSRLTDVGHLDGALTALDSVRESILQLEQAVDLDDEAEVEARGEISISALRREAVEDAEREELARLKVEAGRNLLAEAQVPAHTGNSGSVLEPIEVTQ
jgi:phage shock protein A